jgi:hypothetical protein
LEAQAEAGKIWGSPPPPPFLAQALAGQQEGNPQDRPRNQAVPPGPGTGAQCLPGALERGPGYVRFESLFNPNMGVVYGIRDISNVKWLGDERLETFQSNWFSVINQLRSPCTPGQLAEVLLELLNQHTLWLHVFCHCTAAVCTAHVGFLNTLLEDFVQHTLWLQVFCHCAVLPLDSMRISTYDMASSLSCDDIDHLFVSVLITY